MTGAAFNQVFLPERGRQCGVQHQPMYTDTNAIAILTNATGSSFITSNAAGTRFLVFETTRSRAAPAPTATTSWGHPRTEPAAEQRGSPLDLDRTALVPTDSHHATATRSPLVAPRGGFTLIELMVVVAIATILFAIAIPSYVTYIRESRRTEAKTAVLDLAGREERYLSTSPTAYTAVPANLGTRASGLSWWVAVTTADRVLARVRPQCHRDGPLVYRDRHAVAGQSQVNDAQCTSFSVDSAGQQYANGSAVLRLRRRTAGEIKP